MIHFSTQAQSDPGEFKLNIERSAGVIKIVTWKYYNSSVFYSFNLKRFYNLKALSI